MFPGYRTSVKRLKTMSVLPGERHGCDFSDKHHTPHPPPPLLYSTLGQQNSYFHNYALHTRRKGIIYLMLRSAE